MAIDLDKAHIAPLTSQGLQIPTGTLGSVFTFPPKDRTIPIKPDYSLPDFLEHDIFIIDLQNPRRSTNTPTGRTAALDSSGCWANLNTGRVDTRSIALLAYQSDLNRLLSLGAIFIIFSVGEPLNKIIYGDLDEINHAQGAEFDWCFHSALKSLDFHPSEGITISHGSDPIGAYLDGRYRAVIHGTIPDFCDILAVNRFSEPVSLKWQSPAHGGAIYFLPEVSDKAALLTFLIKEYLPERHPLLFPEYEGRNWLSRPEYEPPQITELQLQIQGISTKAAVDISRIQLSIESLRDEHRHLGDLLTQSGDALVEAVLKTLLALGFPRIVKPDDEIDGTQQDRREDLRFEHNDMITLVEIKGIGGTPKEAASLQVFKYIAPRMKQLKKLNVRGLAIINHQRQVPALERVTDPFQADVLTNAETHDIGLLTTWDLFRLARTAETYGWTFQTIAPIFGAQGRISPIPPCFLRVGQITEIWPKVGALGIHLEAEIHKNSDLLFDCKEAIFQADIMSLEVNKTPRDAAFIGELAGIKLSASKHSPQISQLPKGTTVYCRRRST